MNAPVKLVPAKAKILPDPRVLATCSLASLQTHLHVVINIIFPVNDCDSDPIITHDFSFLMDEITISIGSNDAEIVPAVRCGQVIVDLVSGSCIWSC